MAGHREDEDALFEAQAQLRRQEAEIAEVMAGVASAAEVIERARAELAAEADETRADREEEEKEARSGALGSSRQVLQRRIDRDETTWAEVMSGRDEHASAVDYRDSIGVGIQRVIDQERDKDPEFDEGFERLSTQADFEAPPVRMPDWPVPAEAVQDGRQPVSPEDGRGTTPSTEFGTW
ncbi:hypothetical protein JNB_06464 [Janibacter sp. HTCC2649]|uniref:hypothetical protein n=1 Tax=Janibacter sp. HTCC2649 TaxID=313589 RepID=UPI0000670AB5|nr:hypothetical protein [Janibacter sp. HTCC2649]EAP99790.1 hypothetical protein JNB_06464 [Janibacter sp. HTCC2649]